MFEFFRSLFSPAPPSGATAKERLRLVLLSDHLSLAPDVVEAMKRDLLEVLSRYVEIDVAHADVTFEQREAEVAMLASVPIKSVRERTVLQPERAALVQTAPADAPAAAAPVAQAQVAQAPIPAAPVDEPVDASAAVQGPRPARRRRRKKAGQNGQAPAQTQRTPPGIAASQA